MNSHMNYHANERGQKHGTQPREDARYGEARAADRRVALRPVRSVQALRRHDPRQDFVLAL